MGLVKLSEAGDNVVVVGRKEEGQDEGDGEFLFSFLFISGGADRGDQ